MIFKKLWNLDCLHSWKKYNFQEIWNQIILLWTLYRRITKHRRHDTHNLWVSYKCLTSSQPRTFETAKVFLCLCNNSQEAENHRRIFLLHKQTNKWTNKANSPTSALNLWKVHLCVQKKKSRSRIVETANASLLGVVGEEEEHVFWKVHLFSVNHPVVCTVFMECTPGPAQLSFSPVWILTGRDRRKTSDPVRPWRRSVWPSWLAFPFLCRIWNGGWFVYWLVA